MINEQRLLRDFLELVQVASETKFERKIADVLKQKFTALGLDVREDDTAKVTNHEAGNLICTLEANIHDVEPIFFACHMDTVTPGVGVKPIVKDDIVYSDKTTILGADDKAGIAALLEAIRVIKENNIKHGLLEFIITVGEESGLIGAKALDIGQLKAKYGYALDADERVGTAFIQGAWQAKVMINFYGKTAHSSMPEKGMSAIVMAANAIAKMPHGRIDNETTTNIGIIEGGRETNIVCDLVKLIAEVRSLDPEKMHKQIQLMHDITEEVATSMNGSVDFVTEHMYSGFNHDANAKIVTTFCSALQKCGRDYKLSKTVGGSDANIFNDKGLPTVILSVGYEEIHTKNERMPVGELIKLTELTVKIVEEVRNK